MPLLLPREHGAYGQLLLSLLSALALFGKPRLTSLLLCGAALLLFWAHEPLLLLLGHRGARPKRQLGKTAAILFPLLLCGTLCLVLLAVHLHHALLYPLALPLGLGLSVVPFVLAKQEKTSLAEVLVALALSSWAVPVLHSKHAVQIMVWFVWGSLALSLCVAVLAVRGLLGKTPLWLAWVLSGLGIGCAFVLSRYGVLPKHGWLPEMPALFLALVLQVFKPGPRLLRQVGWAIVAAVSLQALLFQAVV